ncbi:MAG: hypothetical protein LBI18_15890 [Planctomycetaceae bacterium]|jgi:hypothetical protein|nr:hypothetical protein [Planctomycetaceae bacterium]
MTSNDPSKNITPTSISDSTETNQTTTSVEFFDRERWHDVESENDPTQEESVSPKKWATYLLSIGILFLVVVIAGACGFWAVYYFSSLMPEPVVPESYYRTVPTQWTEYVEDFVFFCEVNEPLCFAGNGYDKFYIGDEFPPSIHEFSIKTKMGRTIPLPFKPMAIAMSGSGQLFADQLIVAHPDRIAVYSLNGDPVFSWSVPNTKSVIWSLAVTNNAVFAADTGQRVVYQFDEKGILLKTFGQPSEKKINQHQHNENKTNQDNISNHPSSSESVEIFSGFSVHVSPITLTVSPKTGLIHVTNPNHHRVETFTANGDWKPVLSWGGNDSGDMVGFAEGCNPVDIAVLADGRIVTAEKLITRVKVFYSQPQKNSNRQLNCVVAGPEILDKRPPNIPQLASFHLPAIDTGRPIFITTVRNDVVVFDPIMRVLRYFAALSTPNEEHKP